MADQATWHIFLLKNASNSFGIGVLLDAVLQAESGAEVFELKAVSRDTYTVPTPLYYAKAKTGLIKRNEAGKAIGSIDRGVRLPIYEENKDFGSMKDRAVITLPGAVIEHVWMSGIERLTGV